MKQFASLKPNERPIIAEDGEFMFSKEAVRKIGLKRLEYANQKLELPRFHDGGALDPSSLRETRMTMPERATDSGRQVMGPQKLELHIHGVTNTDEFRTNGPSIAMGIYRLSMQGKKWS
jgi:hypothetical protein